MSNLKAKIAQIFDASKRHPASFVLGILAMVLVGNIAYFSVAGKFGANVDHSTTSIHGGHTLVTAGDSLGGFMSGADKTKLDNLGLTMKGTLKALVTTNVTQSGLASTLDGVAINTDGMAVGTFGQTTTTQDGCWQAHSGAWTRCPELATGSTATDGYYVVVGGTANKGVWALSGGITGTNDLTAVNLSGGSAGTPATTVTNVSYPAAVGTSTNYAREDHVHEPEHPNKFIRLYEDWAAGTVTGDYNWVANVSTGTTTAVATGADATHIGIIQLSTAAGATARASQILGGGSTGLGLSTIYGSAGAIEVEWLVQIPTLSTSGVQGFYAQFCECDTFSGVDQVNGIGFDYNTTDAETHWEFFTASASTRTRTASSVTVNAGQWYRIGWTKPEGSTTLTFKVDGSSVGTISTNIPTTGVFPVATIVKATGTTARTALLDYFWHVETFATPRG